MNANRRLIHAPVPQGKYKVGFLGNPGTGKSTLANNLVEKAVFRSGPVTDGRGLTRRLETHYDEERGVTVFTVPGLDDPQGGRVNAAWYTEQGLRLGGPPTKLVFVMTTESGRIREADLVAKNIYLDSLANVQNLQYGIIVNKMEPKFLKLLDDDEALLKKFTASINVGCERMTPYVHFMERKEELADISDALCQMPRELRDFIDYLPMITINPNDVTPLNISQFDGNFRFLRDRLRSIDRTKKDYLKELKKQRKILLEQYRESLMRAGRPVHYNLMMFRAREMFLHRVFPILRALGLALQGLPMLAAGA